LYLWFCRQTVAPRMATMMPVLVSPIFMVEESTAAIRVSWWSGFMGIGCGFSCMLEGYCSVMLNCWRFWGFSWRGWCWTCLRELRLCSKNRWGSAVSMVGCGKLYLLVIVYCSITMIHQYSISLLVKYINIVHAHLAQYNIQ